MKFNISQTLSFGKKVSDKTALKCLSWFDSRMNRKLFCKNYYKKGGFRIQGHYTFVDGCNEYMSDKEYSPIEDTAKQMKVKGLPQSAPTIFSINSHFHNFIQVPDDKVELFLNLSDELWKKAVEATVIPDFPQTGKPTTSQRKENNEMRWIQYVSNQEDQDKIQIIRNDWNIESLRKAI